MHPRQVFASNFCTPFDTPLTHHTEHFRPRLRHGAQSGGSRRDHTIIWRSNACIALARFLQLQYSACRLYLRCCGFGRCIELVDLLLAQCSRAFNTAGTFGIGFGIGCLCLSREQIGLRLQYFSINRIGCKSSQHLAFFHFIAYIDVQFSQA